MNLNYIFKHQYLILLSIILYSICIFLYSFYDLPSNTTEQLHENITASVESVRQKRTADSFDDEFKLNLRGLDLYRYRWTILERDFCSRRYPHLFMLIVVHTAVPHFKERQAIREMWGDIRLYYKHKTAVLFALGETNNETLRAMVKKESARYRDIIQQNFLDAYRLLVLKGLMWIRFIAEYCPKVPFILKIDDDVAVDYIRLLTLLSSRVRRAYTPLKKLVMCHIMNGSAAIRDKRSKWYISEAEYADKFFSTYCSGLALILTGDIIRPMLSVAQKAPFIWVDDFFLSGYLAVKANASLESIGSLYELNADKALNAMKNGLKLFAVVRNVDHHKRVWKELSSHYE